MIETELKIHIWPDRMLRRRCKKVKDLFSLKDIFDKMYKIMKEKGVKVLAANQIGLDIACLIVEAKDTLFRLVNPSIIKREGSRWGEEDCLSFPYLRLRIKRAENIWINFWDERGNQLDMEAEKDLALLFQHGIDHLNGILFIDRVPFVKRIFLRDYFKNLKENGMPQ
ncbi:MAG: peptide deformylase [Candidatus Omnitrophica bacterium 4484_70.2]|nr:MAG: peptide deformylase [Candidatus Omnitrophica bacterium 4484_70.2]